MAKASKIDDVKRPDKVTPSSTSRPVIVTNRPTMKNDPMVTSDENKEPEESIPMTHGPKVIAPISTDLKPDEPDDTPADTEPEESKDGSTDTVESDKPEAPKGDDSQTEEKPETEEPDDTPKTSDNTEPKESTPPPDASDTKPAVSETRDSEATATAEEIAAADAQAKRDRELEDIISSGKYAVPINAVERRRSRMDTTMLIILAIVLAVILADVIADVGFIHAPSSVPHTHFFSKR